jgi:hypothetical protein
MAKQQKNIVIMKKLTVGFVRMIRSNLSTDEIMPNREVNLTGKTGLTGPKLPAL